MRKRLQRLILRNKEIIRKRKAQILTKILEALWSINYLTMNLIEFIRNLK